MNEREIRVGNIVFDTVTRMEVEVTPEIIHWISKNSRSELNPFGYEPIPLKYRDLEAFSFTHQGDTFQFETLKIISVLYVKDNRTEFWYETKEGGRVVLEYVHQLQNLFFALTSKELKRL